MDLNQTSDQMEMFGYTAEGAQQEADKFVDKDEAPAKDITFKDATRFVAELTPVIGDALAAKEVYDELQKDDPNYFLAGALGGAAIIGLVPGIGDAAASAIRAGAKKALDVGKNVEIDPTAMSAFGAGAIRKKPDDVTKLNQDKVIDEISEVESASNPKPVKISNKQKTVKAYKLFKTNDKGDLYPLFVKMEDNKPIPKGKWIKAEEGSINLKTGKVKSSIGDLAYRPGFHAGDLPIATHIGGKVDLKTGQRLKGSMPPNIREENQVWAEVEMLDEVDWQSVANKRARIKKDGTPDVKTAHITDQVPFGGFYRYKTNPNMTGNWLIGGELKVKKVLSSAEVKKINDKAGVSDLPKLSDLGLKFNKGGAVMEDQMEMAFMNEGGIIDDDLDVDPVSGNEVPPGSLAEEVRDDIPAQLSEGEYVVPADVVRYYGVKFFEDLRDEAKRGLAEMEANGRIGGEPVPDGGPINDQELSPQEMQAIQEMMGMAEGGEVQNPYLQQQQLYSQPRPAPIDEKRNTTITNVNPVENQMPMQSMASGGQVQGYQDSGDVMKDAPSFVQNQFNPAQYGLGFSFMGQQPQQTGTTGTTTTQAPQGQTFTVLYHPDYATNGRSKTFYLPRDNEIYQEYLGRGYTKQMPMTGPAGQGETTPTTTDTPITTDLTGAKVTTGGRRGPKGSTPTPEKVDYSTYDGEQLLEAFDKNRKTRIALTALGAVNPMIALFGQGATRAQEKEIIAAMEAKGIKPPENEATVLDNITDFVSGLFGKDKEEVKTKTLQTKPEPEPIISTASSGPTGIAGERIVSTPTKPEPASSPQEAQAAARKRKKDRRDYQKQRAALMKKRRDTAVKKAKSISKNVKGKGAKALDARKKKSGPFNEGGLMNKKGDK